MSSRRMYAIVLSLLISCCFIFYLFERYIFQWKACIFKSATGIPCPGCGGLRSIHALMEGDVAEALYINPLSVLLVLFVFISVIWIISDIIRGSDSYLQIYKVKWSKPATIAAVAVLLANWIWNICKGL